MGTRKRRADVATVPKTNAGKDYEIRRLRRQAVIYETRFRHAEPRNWLEVVRYNEPATLFFKSMVDGVVNGHQSPSHAALINNAWSSLSKKDQQALAEYFTWILERHITRVAELAFEAILPRAGNAYPQGQKTLIYDVFATIIERVLDKYKFEQTVDQLVRDQLAEIRTEVADLTYEALLRDTRRSLGVLSEKEKAAALRTPVMKRLESKATRSARTSPEPPEEDV